MDERVLNDSAMICCYNAKKINEEQMRVITSNQKLIILELYYIVSFVSVV